MSFRLGLVAATLAFATAGAGGALANPQIGQPAPNFTGTDTNGVSHSLADFRGRTVVLEWTNAGCPFVRKHYDSNNMQALQGEATAQNVVWLSIISSAEGKQGYETPASQNARVQQEGSRMTATILDPTGEIGRLYGAKTTPHMFVIDGEGVLQYMGAIDSNSSANAADVAGATNYVRTALQAVAAGQAPNPASTTPYGCSVKYGS